MRFVKVLVASVLCAALSMGLTGCVEGLANVINTLGSNSTEQTENNTTKQNPEQSGPQETTNPTETTKPVESTTPEGSTIEPGTTIQPSEPSKPDETTTNPGGTVVTPNEDLPADEDGYQYPQYFYNLVNQTMKNAIYIGNGIGYENILKGQTPEIVFVERGEYTDEEETPIIIYAKYCTNPASQEYIYTRLSFTTGGNDYGRLGRPSRYSSYPEYISAVQAALEKKAEFIGVSVSSIEERQDNLNNRLGENFAKCLGENFVDATVNHARMHKMSGVTGDVCEVSGFAYDKDGKSYSYVIQYQLKGTFYDLERVIQFLEDGSMQVNKDFKFFEVKTAPVAGVFQAPETAE